jgi:hypothetical protein
MTVGSHVLERLRENLPACSPNKMEEKEKFLSPNGKNVRLRSSDESARQESCCIKTVATETHPLNTAWVALALAVES